MAEWIRIVFGSSGRSGRTSVRADAPQTEHPKGNPKKTEGFSITLFTLCHSGSTTIDDLYCSLKNCILKLSLQ